MPTSGGHYMLVSYECGMPGSVGKMQMKMLGTIITRTVVHVYLLYIITFGTVLCRHFVYHLSRLKHNNLMLSVVWGR